MKKYFAASLLFLLIHFIQGQKATLPEDDYFSYHQNVIQSELLLTQKKFDEALAQLESNFSSYKFVFRRDYVLAAQIATHLDDLEKTTRYLLKSMEGGWPVKEIRKNPFFRKWKQHPDWISFLEKTKSVNKRATDEQLSDQMHELFKKDQKMALKYLFRIGQRAQDRWAERKFAPHSEEQLAQLFPVILENNYPGERLIINNYWASTILSHHNSFSVDYLKKDTLYRFIRPHLISSIQTGYLSPYIFAMIEDWKEAVESDYESSKYGFIGGIKDRVAFQNIEENRKKMGLRSIELRNQLVYLQKETGMKLYLFGKPWKSGIISIPEE